MKQYRKKPVTIEAVQFDGLNPTEIKDYVGENCEVEIYDNEVTPPVARIIIHTLEGDMEVSKGDYVIKGVKGEFYPCKPDIFEQTYEPAEIQKELEEAAKEYAKITFKKPHSDNPDEEITIIEPDKYAGFIAGARYEDEQLSEKIAAAYQLGLADKEKQMMSEAVECIVEDWNPEPHPEITIPLNPGKFSNGDRARIIIVKED